MVYTTVYGIDYLLDGICYIDTRIPPNPISGIPLLLGPDSKILLFMWSFGPLELRVPNILQARVLRFWPPLQYRLFV